MLCYIPASLILLLGAASATGTLCPLECQYSKVLDISKANDTGSWLNQCQEVTGCAWYTSSSGHSVVLTGCNKTETCPDPQCSKPGKCIGAKEALLKVKDELECHKACTSNLRCQWSTYTANTQMCLLTNDCAAIDKSCVDCKASKASCSDDKFGTPIDGNWTEWANTSVCSEDCGTGKQTRGRTCTNPEPKYNGLACPGKDNDVVKCNQNICPDSAPQSSPTAVDNVGSKNNGEILFKLPIICPAKQPLSRFHFIRFSTPLLDKYLYECHTKDPVCTSIDTVKNTDTWYNAPSVKGNMDHLDKQTVNCGPNGLIMNMKLERSATQYNWRYVYDCCRVPQTQLTCQDINTEHKASGDGSIVYLDKHDIHCPAGQAFQKVHMVSGTTTYYQIRCCGYYNHA